MKRFNNGKISMKVASAMLAASMVVSQAPISVKAANCPVCQRVISDEEGDNFCTGNTELIAKADGHALRCSKTGQEGALESHVDETHDGICDVCGYSLKEPEIQEFSFWDSYEDADLNALEDLSNTKETWLNTHQSVVNSLNGEALYYIIGYTTGDSSTKIYIALTANGDEREISEQELTKELNPPLVKVYKGDSRVSHTVTFNLNYEGAVNDISPISVVSGNKIPEITVRDPKRDNYEFTGWFTSKTEQTEDTKWYQAIINSDTTIYAG